MFSNKNDKFTVTSCILVYFQYLSSLPKKFDDHTVIVSCDEDKKLCGPAIDADVHIVSAEFILTGILKQEYDLNLYPLSVRSYLLFIKKFLCICWKLSCKMCQALTL